MSAFPEIKAWEVKTPNESFTTSDTVKPSLTEIKQLLSDARENLDQMNILNSTIPQILLDKLTNDQILAIKVLANFQNNKQ